jgi:hypothetical protein
MIGGAFLFEAAPGRPPFTERKDRAMTSATLLLALALGAAPKAAPPICSPPAPARLDAPFAYATSVIEGLAWVQKATRRLPIDTPAEVPAVVAALGKAQGDFACACRHVEPFVRSTAEGIRTAAVSLAAKCEALPATTAAMASALQAQADEAGKERAPGSRSADERLDEAIQRKNQAWGEFLVASAESIGTLVERRDGSLTGRMLVTKAERRALKAQLERAFGKSIGRGRNEEQDPLTTVAAGWYEVLANLEFHALDEK